MMQLRWDPSAPPKLHHRNFLAQLMNVFLEIKMSIYYYTGGDPFVGDVVIDLLRDKYKRILRRLRFALQ